VYFVLYSQASSQINIIIKIKNVNSHKTKMEQLKEEFNQLKANSESPMMYLIEYFKDMLSRIDLAAEKFKEKLNDDQCIGEHLSQINWCREAMIKRIESYENECYANLKKSTSEMSFSENIKENMKPIETKLNAFGICFNLNANFNANESSLADQLKSLIDAESLKLYSKLFLNQSMLFFENYENNQNFGKLIVVNNEYIGCKSLEYIHE